MTKKILQKNHNLHTSARKLGLYNDIAKKHEESGRCIFCNLKEKYVITRQDGWVLTVNLFPRSTGDLLVIPERHIETYMDLTDLDYQTLGRLNKFAMKLLTKTLKIDSFYLLLRDGTGTDKTIRHLHGHVQHYWKGLIDWHPQEEMKPPLEIANQLKERLSH